ncbi:hypothetical protein PIB30_009658 [Stylosanthes scabra]|uniref:Uncharacterized protein n=1 Tax=Stylosanthes scabra TaxID=79078 RepID=A0ABU6T753_9FABA|nr:hypothetical protein [Stylosanthes scabra]
MASRNSTTSTDPLPNDIAAKALMKSFDALITVRTKAIKGKGVMRRPKMERKSPREAKKNKESKENGQKAKSPNLP